MNVETGQIHEGEEDIAKAKIAAKLAGEHLIRIPDKHLEKVKKMTLDDRKAYANRLVKRRKHARNRRKANRKRRGRR